MVKLPVDNGAEVNSGAFRRLEWGPRLIDNWSNLHVAAHMGNSDVIEYLLVKGADIHVKCTRGDEGLTPLHLAARNGRVGAVKVLIAKGADVNAKDGRGDKCLHFIAKNPISRLRTLLSGFSWEGIVQSLINNGADVNVRDSEGRTPLWWAEEGGNRVVA